MHRMVGRHGGGGRPDGVRVGYGVSHLFFELGMSRGQRDGRDRAGGSSGIGVSRKDCERRLALYLHPLGRSSYCEKLSNKSTANYCTTLGRRFSLNKQKGNRAVTRRRRLLLSQQRRRVRRACRTRCIHSQRRDVAGADRSACSDPVSSSLTHFYASYVDPRRVRPATMLNGR